MVNLPKEPRVSMHTRMNFSVHWSELNDDTNETSDDERNANIDENSECLERQWSVCEVGLRLLIRERLPLTTSESTPPKILLLEW